MANVGVQLVGSPWVIYTSRVNFLPNVVGTGAHARKAKDVRVRRISNSMLVAPKLRGQAADSILWVHDSIGIEFQTLLPTGSN